MTFSLRSGFDFGFSPAPQVVAEMTKLLYIVVVDEEENEGKTSFRYTRPVLQSTLQLMGCKARHAFKMSKRIFEIIRGESPTSDRRQDGAEVSCSDPHKKNSVKEDSSSFGCGLDKAKEDKQFLPLKEDRHESKTFEFYKKRTTVVVRRETFLNVVCNALTEYNYLGHNQRADLVLACRIREKKQSVTVLLCGTSGCGKSTLSSLLGSRLGITTMISTDSIRHMMRSFVDEKQNPLLWSSTYHAGEFLDPVAVAEAKAKKRAKKMEGIAPTIAMGEALSSSSTGNYDDNHMQLGSSGSKLINPKQMAIEGFKAQSEMVIDSLDRLITAWEERKESVVVEGVHLSLNFVMGLMKKHPSIIPFMIYISNEEKHLERFAVRAKYMTLDPAKNKYVKYIKNIRTIQEYLCRRADKHLVPKINNTNVDRSVATIHATVFSCLRRRNMGEQLYDSTTNTVAVVDEEYRSQCVANSLLSSKGLLQLIQRNGSNRQLMALLNADGSVSKVWPVDSVESYEMSRVVNMEENGINNPVYGHLHIGKAEPVNLPFGNFGISAWPNNGGTSHCGTSVAGSMEDSKGETETGSRHYSSCCSSPTSYGNSKELMEEQSVYGSDEEEEVYDTPQDESDDDLHDANSDQIHEEVGSVDEEAKTDEEYDDLAIQDVQESGYWSDNDELRDTVVKGNNMKGDNCCRITRFQRSRSDHLSENYLSNSSSPLAKETYQKILPSRRIKNRSNSIPFVGKTRVYVQ